MKSNTPRQTLDKTGNYPINYIMVGPLHPVTLENTLVFSKATLFFQPKAALYVRMTYCNTPGTVLTKNDQTPPPGLTQGGCQP